MAMHEVNEQVKVLNLTKVQVIEMETEHKKTLDYLNNLITEQILCQKHLQNLLKLFNLLTDESKGWNE